MSEVVSINNKIVEVSIKSNDKIIKEANPFSNITVDKLERPDILRGTTYKIKTPLTKSSMYITINDIILNGGTEFETKQPFEIFINSRDVSSFQWVTSLTRMISAVFRRGGDVSFIVRELLATYDTSGGYLARGGVYVPSLVAEIGLIIEKHFKSIGIISDDKVDPSIIKYVEDSAKEANIDLNTIKGEYCESCHHHSVIKIDGCASCVNCGASKCS